MRDCSWDSRVALALRDGPTNREGGSEIRCICPRCGMGSLLVTPWGKYFCFVCTDKVKGRLPMLPVWMRKPKHVSLPAQPAGSPYQRKMPREEKRLWDSYRRFLKRRGIAHEVAAYAGLYPSFIQDRPAVVFPHQLYWPGGSGGYIARCLDEKKPKYLRSGGSLGSDVPNFYLHDSGAMPAYWQCPVIYVVEGPVDALRWLSYTQAHPGTQAAYGNRVVALGGLYINTAAGAILNQAAQIIWVLDNDEAGHEASAKFREAYKGSMLWAEVFGDLPIPWPEDPGKWQDSHFQDFFAGSLAYLKRCGLHTLSPESGSKIGLRVGQILGERSLAALPHRRSSGGK